MINFNNLSGKELAKDGLTFDTPEEANLFVTILLEELDMRIRDAVSQNIEEAAIRELDRCSTKEEKTAWLDENYPGYSEIVRKKQNELYSEIMEFRDRIPGVSINAPKNIRDIKVEELGLSIRSMNCLRRAGISTVGALLDHGNLSDIRNLGAKSQQEVRRKLLEVTSPEYALVNHLMDDEYMDDEYMDDECIDDEYTGYHSKYEDLESEDLLAEDLITPLDDRLLYEYQ